MLQRGAFAAPLLEKLLASSLQNYKHCFIPNSEELLSLKKQNLKLIKSSKTLNKFPYIVNQNLSLPKIRENGKKLIETFKDFPEMDFFVVGDFAAMKFASRLSLWFFENNLKNKFIAVPCCPFNSVPFTEFSAGFGSALKWCADTATAFLMKSCKPQPEGLVGIMEIKDDKTGWLTSGSAALCGFPKQTLTIVPGYLPNTKSLLTELRRIIKVNKTALVVVGDSLKICSGKGIIHHKQKTGQIICDIVSKAGIPAVKFQISPGILFDNTHISKQDNKLSKAFAVAAVKLARKSKSNIMVVNRFGSGVPRRLTFEAVSLYDAVNTPRRRPEKFLSKKLRSAAALKKYLELFAN